MSSANLILVFMLIRCKKFKNCLKSKSNMSFLRAEQVAVLLTWQLKNRTLNFLPNPYFLIPCISLIEKQASDMLKTFSCILSSRKHRVWYYKEEKVLQPDFFLNQKQSQISKTKKMHMKPSSMHQHAVHIILLTPFGAVFL